MFNCITHPLTVGEGADVAALAPHRRLDFRHGVGGGGQEPGILGREHRQVVEVVASGKDLGALEAQPAGQFGQGGAFIVGDMAEARVNVVAHDGQVGRPLAVLFQVAVNDVHVAIAAGDEAERRERIFVDARMEAGIDPLNNFRQVGLHPPEHFGMSAGAGAVPLLEADIL